MSCNPLDDSDCCCTVLYNQNCPKCRMIARVLMFITKCFQKTDNVRFRPMTPEERAEYRFPVALGDHGDMVVGMFPVLKRLFLEWLGNGEGYVIHGTFLLQKEALMAIRDGKCCFACRCMFGRHCKYCKKMHGVVTCGIKNEVASSPTP